MWVYYVIIFCELQNKLRIRVLHQKYWNCFRSKLIRLCNKLFVKYREENDCVDIIKNEKIK
ncbi:hypothetical protein BpHYR1_001571 [Brachionus plicatilis]|uniref:Uncharacterized protein n=1 Tax=Brachionus plicatilis TaxID=10195 RepID=A0A3M7Q9Y3_BRAPC|nr:hypothetical protein BpHYR1_001571 [Brachionus plicatilis]